MARTPLLAATLLAACATLATARAAEPSAWTPVAYTLGGQPLVPTTLSTTIAGPDISEDSIVVTGQRAPQSTLPGSQLPTPQEVFNITGDDYRRPANCDLDYTTTEGQPAEATDITTASGIHGCYF